MSFYKRFCSVLLVFVCLFVLFSNSLPVLALNADGTTDYGFYPGKELDPDPDNPPMMFGNMNNSVNSSNLLVQNILISEDKSTWYTHSGWQPFAQDMVYTSFANWYVPFDSTVYQVIRFCNQDKTHLGTKHKTLSISLDGSDLTLTNGNYENFQSSNLPSPDMVYIADSFGNNQVLTASEFDLDIYKSDTGFNLFKFTFDVTLPIDATMIEIYFKHDLSGQKEFYEPNSTNVKYRQVNTRLAINSYTFDEKEESVGLLKSVIEWLKSIKDGISNVFNSIAELPSNLWSAIENGLKGLFVPDDTYMSGYKDKWAILLADRLGAVYQSVNIIFESWDGLKTADVTNSIQFPKVTINLPQGNSFSFGGVLVKVVPDGFGFVATSLKAIVGIACTILFINGLRNKYDEVMGVEK